MSSDDSEDEIFFGPISSKERQKAEKLRGRRTMLLNRSSPLFKPDWSVPGKDGAAEPSVDYSTPSLGDGATSCTLITQEPAASGNTTPMRPRESLLRVQQVLQESGNASDCTEHQQHQQHYEQATIRSSDLTSSNVCSDDAFPSNITSEDLFYEESAGGGFENQDTGLDILKAASATKGLDNSECIHSSSIDLQCHADECGPDIEPMSSDAIPCHEHDTTVNCSLLCPGYESQPPLDFTKHITGTDAAQYSASSFNPTYDHCNSAPASAASVEAATTIRSAAETTASSALLDLNPGQTDQFSEFIFHEPSQCPAPFQALQCDYSYLSKRFSTISIASELPDNSGAAADISAVVAADGSFPTASAAASTDDSVCAAAVVAADASLPTNSAAGCMDDSADAAVHGISSHDAAVVAAEVSPLTAVSHYSVADDMVASTDVSSCHQDSVMDNIDACVQISGDAQLAVSGDMESAAVAEDGSFPCTGVAEGLTPLVSVSLTSGSMHHSINSSTLSPSPPINNSKGPSDSFSKLGLSSRTSVNSLDVSMVTPPSPSYGGRTPLKVPSFSSLTPDEVVTPPPSSRGRLRSRVGSAGCTASGATIAEEPHDQEDQAVEEMETDESKREAVVFGLSDDDFEHELGHTAATGPVRQVAGVGDAAAGSAGGRTDEGSTDEAPSVDSERAAHEQEVTHSQETTDDFPRPVSSTGSYGHPSNEFNLSSLSLLADVAVEQHELSRGSSLENIKSIVSITAAKTPSAPSTPPLKQVSMEPKSVSKTPNRFVSEYLPAQRLNSATTPKSSAKTPNESTATTPGSPACEKFLAFARQLKEEKANSPSPLKAPAMLNMGSGLPVVRNINKQLGLHDTHQTDESPVGNVSNLLRMDDAFARDDSVMMAASMIKEDIARVVKAICEKSDQENKTDLVKNNTSTVKPRMSYFSSLDVIDVEKPAIYGTFITEEESVGDEETSNTDRNIMHLDVATSNNDRQPPHNEVQHTSITNDTDQQQQQAHNTSDSSAGYPHDISHQGTRDGEHYDDYSSFNYSAASSSYGAGARLNDTLEEMELLLQASKKYNAELAAQRQAAEAAALQQDAEPPATGSVLQDTQIVSVISGTVAENEPSIVSDDCEMGAEEQAEMEEGVDLSYNAGDDGRISVCDRPIDEYNGIDQLDAASDDSDGRISVCDIPIDQFNEKTEEVLGGNVPSSPVDDFSVVSPKKHSLASRVSNASSFNPTMDSTHASAVRLTAQERPSSSSSSKLSSSGHCLPTVVHGTSECSAADGSAMRVITCSAPAADVYEYEELDESAGCAERDLIASPVTPYVAAAEVVPSDSDCRTSSARVERTAPVAAVTPRSAKTTPVKPPRKLHSLKSDLRSVPVAVVSPNVTCSPQTPRYESSLQSRLPPTFNHRLESDAHRNDPTPGSASLPHRATAPVAPHDHGSGSSAGDGCCSSRPVNARQQVPFKSKLRPPAGHSQLVGRTGVRSPAKHNKNLLPVGRTPTTARLQPSTGSASAGDAAAHKAADRLSPFKTPVRASVAPSARLTTPHTDLTTSSRVPHSAGVNPSVVNTGSRHTFLTPQLVRPSSRQVPPLLTKSASKSHAGSGVSSGSSHNTAAAAAAGGGRIVGTPKVSRSRLQQLLASSDHNLPKKVVSPVARSLLTNPPPSLVTTVRPRCAISGQQALLSHAAAAAAGDTRSQQQQQLGEHSLDSSLLEREAMFERIQRGLDQLSAKSPGGGMVSGPLASGLVTPSCPPSSPASKSAPLPPAFYTQSGVSVQFVGGSDKENVRPVRPCCKRTPQAGSSEEEPRLQVLRHRGRVLLSNTDSSASSSEPSVPSSDGDTATTKGEDDREPLMEVSIIERKSISYAAENKQQQQQHLPASARQRQQRHC